MDSYPSHFGVMAYTELPRQSALHVASSAVWDDVPALVAYGCLALAALFLPRRRTRVGIAVAVVGIGVAVTYTVLELWSRDGLAPVFAAVPPLLVAVLAFLVAGRTTPWVPTVGLALLGLAALALVGNALDRVYLYPLYEADAFLQPGLRYSVQESAAVSLAATVDAPTMGYALAPVIPLAAAAVITAACLRRPAQL